LPSWLTASAKADPFLTAMRSVIEADAADRVPRPLRRTLLKHPAQRLDGLFGVSERQGVWVDGGAERAGGGANQKGVDRFDCGGQKW